MENLRKLQLIETGTLREVMRICEAHNLKCFLVFGTLLGALRHNGYIPWDDDLDIAMPEEDYDLFVKYAKAELSSDYFLHDLDSDPRYFPNIVRIRRNDTTFIPDAYKKAEFVHNGVWIDVFPLHYAKSDHSVMEKLKFFILRRILSAMTAINVLGIEGNNPTKRACASFIQKMDLKMIRRWYERIARSCKKKNGKYYVCEYVDNNMKHWYHPVENFGEGRMHTFEGIRCRIPSEAEKVLTQIYGDYMQLPPEEARVGHLPLLFDLSAVNIDKE